VLLGKGVLSSRIQGLHRSDGSEAKVQDYGIPTEIPPCAIRTKSFFCDRSPRRQNVRISTLKHIISSQSTVLSQETPNRRTKTRSHRGLVSDKAQPPSAGGRSWTEEQIGSINVMSKGGHPRVHDYGFPPLVALGIVTPPGNVIFDDYIMTEWIGKHWHTSYNDGAKYRAPS
jgi:hypothetical protein